MRLSWYRHGRTMASDERATAASPFDKADADLVLRSSDNIDFFVSRAIMALASPIFADMFIVAEQTSASARSAATACGSDAPAVDLTEHGRGLDNFLRFIYPVKNPVIEKLEDALDVLEVASKYMVDHIAEEASKRFEMLAEEQPLRAYALAYICRREDAMRIAAKVSLLYPWPESTRNIIEELGTTINAALIRLQEYHTACGAAASSVTRAEWETTLNAPPSLETRPLFAWTHRSVWRNHPLPRFHYVAHAWWKASLEKLEKIVQSTPHPRVTTTQAFFGTFLANAMPESSIPGNALCSALLSFMRVYTTNVEAAVSEVRLTSGQQQ